MLCAFCILYFVCVLCAVRCVLCAVCCALCAVRCVPIVPTVLCSVCCVLCAVCSVLCSLFSLCCGWVGRVVGTVHTYSTYCRTNCSQEKRQKRSEVLQKMKATPKHIHSLFVP